MQIIGHKEVSSFTCIKVATITQIRQTPPNSYVIFTFTSKELIDFCKQNNVKFGLIVSTLKEVIFANIHGASFVIVDQFLCNDAQKIANEYLFDMKIFVNIKDDDTLEKFALDGIDGVIFLENISTQEELQCVSL
ncbi:MAG: hypothetical protein IBX44_09445 [Sulfurospirillum sp.]|nr:hypothetical protein [Sulfurospirillum sp.]